MAMSAQSGLPLLVILVPFIVAPLSLIIARLPRLGQALAKTLSIATALSVFLVLLLLATVVRTTPIDAEFFSFPLGNTTATLGLYVDSVALLPAILCSFVGVLGLIYMLHYLSPENKAYSMSFGFNRLYPLSLILVASVTGALFSSNMISLLFFWELISLCLFGMISFWNRERDSIRAAFKCFVITHVGSLALFVATIVLFFETGTLRFFEFQNGLLPTGIVALITLPLILVALLPKAVQMPFHTWLPDSTVAPTPVMLFILASDLAGIYLIIRFFTQIFNPVMMQLPLVPFSGFFGSINVWSFILSIIGVITLLFAAANALLETNLKRILAYSVISELGYSVMVAGFATALGVVSGLFYLASHVFVAGLLFLCMGAVIYATGKTNLDQIGGLYRYMPLTSTLSAISVLAIGGLPLLSEFTGKYLIIHSTLEIGSPFFLAATILGGVFHLAIALRLLYSVFLSKDEHRHSTTKIKDPPMTMIAPMVVMAAFIVILGIAPATLLNSLILPGIGQIGLPLVAVESFGIVSTSLGFWTPLVIAVSVLPLVLVLTVLVNRFTKKKQRDLSNADAFKPFLCGEDATDQYDSQSGLHYQALLPPGILDKAEHRSNIDRFYYFLIRKFTAICNALSRFDIGQRFSLAFLSFIVGTIIFLIIVIFAV
jgi:NADH:ubiquinone oxidoreductase subunit 5 (subunit L)/multisubunit Na+/H+ antiporter MnhA subunit